MTVSGQGSGSATTSCPKRPGHTTTKLRIDRFIDDALLRGDADLAVHCLEDIPGDIPITAGLAFGGYPSREDVHDAIITRDGRPLAEQPDGSMVGTSSVRRAAQLRLHYPH